MSPVLVAIIFVLWTVIVFAVAYLVGFFMAAKAAVDAVRDGRIADMMDEDMVLPDD